MTYLAYVHARPDTVDATGIFYVGKGRKSRAYSLSARNRHHGNIVAKHGAENILTGIFECSSEKIAFELERGLIKCLRRMGVELTNQTDGGEGASGLTHSLDTRERMSIAVRAGLTQSIVEQRNVAIKYALSNPEVHAKRSAAIREAWQNKELRTAASANARSLWANPVFTEKQRKARQESWKSPEVRAKRSAAVKQAKIKPEARKAVSETMKQVYKDPVMRQEASMRTKGTIWVNDGVQNKRVLPAAVPEGFVVGKLPHKTKSIQFA